MNNELNDFLKVISGEMALEKKQKEIEKAKQKAVEEEKDNRRKEIVDGKVKLVVEEAKAPKVVQNIKLFEWEAQDRYEMPFDKKLFTVIVVLTLALTLLFAILGHYFLMGAMIALVFLVYVLGTTKPQNVVHRITKKGFDTGGKLYEWHLLSDFYFTKKGDQLTLIVRTKLNFPGALILLLNEKEKDPIFVLLQDKLAYRDIRKQGRLDKMNWGEYIPLDKI
jgi:hypothetical protein